LWLGLQLMRFNLVLRRNKSGKFVRGCTLMSVGSRESVAGIGDTYFFYDSLEDVHERYREYCEAHGKRSKERL
jgi:hypothetical protein